MNIDILGAGAFGTSLAIVFSRRHSVRLVALPQYVAALQSRHNPLLPQSTIPENITIDSAFSQDPDVVFVATPTQEIKNVTKSLTRLAPSIPLVFCSKGLFVENNTPYFMTTYARQTLKNPLHVLAGPDFAKELASFKKSFANIAGPKADDLCQSLSQEPFLLDPWHDPIGLQLTGALKNVFAIAAGYFEGQGKGSNEKSALFPQAFEEIITLGKHFWPHEFDMASLLTYGGVGDLVLTCTSTQSRNFSLGLSLGQGQSISDFQKVDKGLAEGAYTAKSLNAIKGALALPLCDLVYDLLYKN